MNHKNKYKAGSPAMILMGGAKKSGNSVARVLMGKGHDRQFAEGGEIPDPRVPVNVHQQMLSNGGSVMGKRSGATQMSLEDRDDAEGVRHGESFMQATDRSRCGGGRMKAGGNPKKQRRAAGEAAKTRHGYPFTKK